MLTSEYVDVFATELGANSFVVLKRGIGSAFYVAPMDFERNLVFDDYCMLVSKHMLETAGYPVFYADTMFMASDNYSEEPGNLG